MAFYVGQKVELVEDFDDNHKGIAKDYGFELPRKGRVYTVRDLEAGGGNVWIRLAELVNHAVPYLEGDAEPHFLAKRFRPVVERKTDISELVRIAQEAARTGKVFA